MNIGFPLFPALLIGFLSCNLPPSKSRLANVEIGAGSTYTDTIGPLIYASTPSDGEYGFIGIPATRLKAKLIPNLEQREKRGMATIDSIIGVTHFFLDHDLSSGFVHPYTRNFFKRLRAEDFVMKFTRMESDSMVGYVEYIYKKDMQASDSLGSNIAFFRQWKLSDFGLQQDGAVTKVNMKPCKFAPSANCPQTNPKTDNPFQPEIPIWDQWAGEGEVLLSTLNHLGAYSGGTVVIIWETVIEGETKIMFLDIHGSIELILRTAMAIARKYEVDPHIAISDAGPFAVKVKANSDNILDCKKLKALAPRGQRMGAGFGYIPE